MDHEQQELLRFIRGSLGEATAHRTPLPTWQRWMRTTRPAPGGSFFAASTPKREVPPSPPTQVRPRPMRSAGIRSWPSQRSTVTPACSCAWMAARRSSRTQRNDNEPGRARAPDPGPLPLAADARRTGWEAIPAPTRPPRTQANRRRTMSVKDSPGCACVLSSWTGWTSRPTPINGAASSTKETTGQVRGSHHNPRTGRPSLQRPSTKR